MSWLPQGNWLPPPPPGGPHEGHDMALPVHVPFKPQIASQINT